MKKIFSFILIIALFASCTATTKVQGESFGETIKVKSPMTYDAMLAKLEGGESLDNVQVEGKVREVCKKKGCWMTIYSDASSSEMMVKFKDYGFFVPKDISGKSVVMEGKAYKETTSVEELRHYAEDAGKSDEEVAKITEPKVELKFLATGVIVKS